LSSVDPIEAMFTRILGSAGNLALRLDPLSAARLEALDGRTLRFEIATPGRTEPRILTLSVNDGQIQWLARSTDQPNVIVSGSLPAIAGLLANPEATTDVFIDGDESILTEFGDLLKRFEPDLAGPVSELVGTELADDLIGMAEAGIAFLRSASESVTRAAAESARDSYLGGEELDAMLNELDALRLRTDRLAARVGLLESARASE